MIALDHKVAVSIHRRDVVWIDHHRRVKLVHDRRAEHPRARAQAVAIVHATIGEASPREVHRAVGSKRGADRPAVWIKASVLHFWLSEDDTAYRAVDGAALKYEYDLGRARALLGEAGWIRGSDGQFRDTRGAMTYRVGVAGPQQPWVGEAALIWNSWEWHWR